MKTIKCRPVLVESEIANIYKCRTGGLGYKEVATSYTIKGQGQQLILISLDTDDKVEKWDIVYDENNNSIGEFIGWTSSFLINTAIKSFNKPKKVIATQSQIPPEYIQQFIEEYNKGEVNDVEIEMEEYDHDEEWSEISGAYETCRYRPKLTNGFVTIVKKELSIKHNYNLLCNMQYYMEYCQINGYVTPQEWLEKYKHYDDKKEPILYTEDETKDLCKKILLDYIRDSISLRNTDFDRGLSTSFTNHKETNIDSWFKQNKKK